MAKTPSSMVELKTSASDFRLPNIDKKWVSLEDYKSYSGFLVAFICNHCPFVKHINQGLVELACDYMPKGIGVVAINSNDVEKYPEDAPEYMVETAIACRYPFAYLFDETQEVARTYQAACTPDFFFYNGNRELIYRGRMDGSSPGNDVPVDAKDLRQVFDEFLAGQKISVEQRPSIGCNIKWRP